MRQSCTRARFGAVASHLRPGEEIAAHEECVSMACPDGCRSCGLSAMAGGDFGTLLETSADRRDPPRGRAM